MPNSCKVFRFLLLAVTTAYLLLATAYSQSFNKDFSADVVSNLAGHETTSRFYASKTKIRTEHIRNGVVTGINIWDNKSKTAWMLIPQRKTAMDLSAQYGMAMEAAKAILSGKPPDPNDPCATIQGCTAKRLGSEVVNGRQTQKWEIRDKDGNTMTAWIDGTLPLAVKAQYESGTAEFRNIKEGPQPDSLFQVPADYHKISAPSGVPAGAPRQ